MILKNRTILLLVISACFLPLLQASQNFEIVKLENGLTVVIEFNKTSTMINFATIVKFGSRNEPLGMQGAAHLLEHLVFNGTNKRTQKQIYAEVDFIGAYNNASTTRATTTFIMLAPIGKAEEALELQADMLLNSTLKADKIDKEKQIVIEEINKDDSMSHYAADNYFSQKILRESGYSHSVLGSRETVSNAKRKDLLSLYHTHYTPSNMILWITGNFEKEKLLGWVKKHFVTSKQIPPENKKKQNSIPPQIRYDGNLYSLTTERARTNHILLTFPAPGNQSEDFAAYKILTEIIKNRLQTTLKPNLKLPIIRISAEHVAYETWGYLKITIVTPPVQNPSLTAAVVAEYIKSFALSDISEGVIKTQVTKLMVERSILAEKPHIATFMNGETIGTTTPQTYMEFLKRLSAVTLKEIQATAGRYLKPLRFTGVALRPGTSADTEEKIIVSMEILEKAKHMLDRKTLVNESNVPIIKGRSYPQAKTSKTVEKTLHNGMKIGIIQSPGSPVFAAHLLIKNRSSLEPENKKGIASLLHRLLLSGTEKMNSKQLTMIVDGLGMKLTTNDNPMIPFDDIYTSPTYSYMRLETVSDFHEPALIMLYNLMYHSTFPEKEIEQKKKEQIDLIKRSGNSPSAVASRNFNRSLFGEEHPLAIPHLGTEKDVLSISRSDILKFRDFYFAPDNIIMTVSSSLPADRILHLVNSLFGAESISYLPLEVRAFQNIEAKSKGEKVIKGGVKQSYINFGYLIPFSPKKTASLILATRLMSEKLSFELREKMGLAYPISASIRFFKHNALFLFKMGTSPGKISSATKAIEKTLEAMEDYEPSPLEIERTRNKYIGRLGMRTLSRINQAYYAGIGIFYYRDIDNLTNTTKKIKNIGSDDVLEALKVILNNRKPLTIITEPKIGTKLKSMN